MKLSGFLISWAMPAVNWPSKAAFGPDQSVLRSAQIVEGEQRLNQFDLTFGKRLNL